MKTTRKPDSEAVYTIRVDREVLDRLHEISSAEHRTLAQKIRVMFDAEIALHDQGTPVAA